MSLVEAAVLAAEIFVKTELAGNDGSHDYFHIDRVRKTAVSLAKEEVRIRIALTFEKC